MKKKLLIAVFFLVSIINLNATSKDALKKYLVPVPKNLSVSKAFFTPNNGRIIAYNISTSTGIRFTVTHLQKILKENGLHFSVAGGKSTGELPEIELIIDSKAESKSQGYTLIVKERSIKITANNEAGLYYGVLTLGQIAKYAGDSGKFPQVEISDYPDFKRRGITLDLSRNKVPTMKSLYQYIDMFASWKINEIQLYSEHTFEYQKKMCVLDIYYPQTEEKVPVIVWIHGGGLTGGKKQIPWALKSKGCIVVSINYRLAPKVKGEDCITDTAASIAWVFNNIKDYNGNPNLIFVSGASAGGYLALMTVMDKSLLKKHHIDSNTIAGLIPFTGHTITHFQIRKESGILSKQPIIDKFAPLYHVRKDAPPILLMTGDRELEILGRYEENAYFYRMMKICGHTDISQLEMQGYGHYMVNPAFPLLLEFVEKIKNRKKNKLNS